MKKVTIAATAALLTLSLCMPVMAGEDMLILTDAPGSAPPSDVPALTLPVQKVYPVRMTGIITAETDDSITVQNAINAEDSIVLHLAETTCIVDAETGLPTPIKERTSDRVIVYYGPATTLSLPPQSSAVMVAVNAPEKGTSPHYAVVESVRTEVDGSAVKILTDNGSLYVTINRDRPISPYLTKNLVTIDNIREGSELLLWYDMVAMSYPAQTTTLKTVIVRNAPVTPDVPVTPLASDTDRIILSLDAGIVSINGVELNLLGIRYDHPNGETPFIPLRQVCEGLGYEVKWIAGTDKVEITKEQTTVVLQFSSHTYTVGGLTVTTDHAPIVEKGLTYAPICFFEEILGVAVSLTTEGV